MDRWVQKGRRTDLHQANSACSLHRERRRGEEPARWPKPVSWWCFLVNCSTAKMKRVCCKCDNDPDWSCYCNYRVVNRKVFSLVWCSWLPQTGWSWTSEDLGSQEEDFQNYSWFHEQSMKRSQQESNNHQISGCGILDELEAPHRILWTSWC